MFFLKKLNIYLQYDAAIPPLVIYARAMKAFMSVKIQLAIKLRRKKGNFIQLKLRIITQEAASQKTLRILPPVRSRRHSHIRF